MNAKEKKKEQKPRSEDSDAGTADLIRELGLAAPGTDFESDLQYISIIGSIEGHIALPMENKTTKYEHLIPQLIAVEENPKLRGLLVILNTMGGDVEAGLALDVYKRQALFSRMKQSTTDTCNGPNPSI